MDVNILHRSPALKGFCGAKNAPGRINGQRTPAESGATPPFCEIDGWRPRVPYAGFLVSDVAALWSSLCGVPCGDGRQNLPEQGTHHVGFLGVLAGKKSSRYISVAQIPQDAHPSKKIFERLANLTGNRPWKSPSLYPCNTDPFKISLFQKVIKIFGNFNGKLAAEKISPLYISSSAPPPNFTHPKNFQKFGDFDDKECSGKISPLYPCNTDMPKRSPI